MDPNMPTPTSPSFNQGQDAQTTEIFDRLMNMLNGADGDGIANNNADASAAPVPPRAHAPVTMPTADGFVPSVLVAHGNVTVTVTGTGPDARTVTSAPMAPAPTQDPRPARVPNAVRPHIAHACEHCRIRKARCSGTHPCKRCQTRSLACEYKERPVKVTRVRRQQRPRPRRMDSESSGATSSQSSATDSMRWGTEQVRGWAEQTAAADADAPTAGAQDASLLDEFYAAMPPHQQSQSVESVPHATGSNDAENPEMASWGSFSSFASSSSSSLSSSGSVYELSESQSLDDADLTNLTALAMNTAPASAPPEDVQADDYFSVQRPAPAPTPARLYMTSSERQHAQVAGYDPTPTSTSATTPDEAASVDAGGEKIKDDQPSTTAPANSSAEGSAGARAAEADYFNLPPGANSGAMVYFARANHTSAVINHPYGTPMVEEYQRTPMPQSWGGRMPSNRDSTLEATPAVNATTSEPLAGVHARDFFFMAGGPNARAQGEVAYSTAVDGSLRPLAVPQSWDAIQQSGTQLTAESLERFTVLREPSPSAVLSPSSTESTSGSTTSSQADAADYFSLNAGENVSGATTPDEHADSGAATAALLNEYLQDGGENSEMSVDVRVQ